MCGLFGMLSRSWDGIQYGERQFLNDLAILNYFRGVHSYGLLKYHRETGLDVLKSPDTILFGVDSGDVDRFVTPENRYRKSKKGHIVQGPQKNPIDLVVGHTRQATMGKVSEKNSHPFECRDFQLFHNGTIEGLTDIKNDPHYGNADTDSERLAHLIQSKIGSENPSKEDYGTAICHALEHLAEDERVKKITYALVLVTNHGDVLFIRNSARPLSFAYTKTGLMFSSTGKSLQFAISQNYGCVSEEVTSKVFQDFDDSFKEEMFVGYKEHDEYLCLKPHMLWMVSRGSPHVPSKTLYWDFSHLEQKEKRTKPEDAKNSGDPKTKIYH